MPLDEITDPELGNDRATAAQAAIEGHATLVMLEYMAAAAQGSHVDVRQIPGFTDGLRQAMSGIDAQYPALAGAPRVVRESLLYPYVEGATYVYDLWMMHDRVPPFGPYLPRSTEQVRGGWEAWAGTAGDELEPIPLEVEVEGARVVYEDTMGELELRIFAETLGVPGISVRGWGGDRLVLAVAWDAGESGGIFSRRVQARLDALPAPAAVEYMLETDAGMVTLLRVGGDRERPVEVRRGTTP